MKMKPALARPILLSFLLLLVLIAINAAISYTQTRTLYDDARFSKSYDVLRALSDTTALVRDAEIAQRSYMLTGDPSFLEPYQRIYSSRADISTRLRQLFEDRPEQQARLSELEQKVAERLQVAEQGIAIRRDQGMEAARDFVAAGTGRRLTGEVDAIVTQMENEENARLRRRLEASRKTFSYATLAEFAMLALVLASIGYAFVVIRREILSRYRAEAYAHEQREWCLTTLTSIGDAVIVTDTDGIIVLLNTVAGKLTGWHEEAVGRPLKDVFRIVNETTRKPVENPVDKVLREGKIVGLANHTVLINRENVDVPIDDSGAPVKNKKGELTGVVLVFRDITERRRADAAMLRSQQQFQLIAQTIPQMVWMARPDGYVEYFNERWLDYTGLTLEKSQGPEWQNVVHPADLPRTLEKWERSLKTGEPCEIEYRLRRADGKYLWHIGRAIALTGDEGRIVHWFGTNTEFDELKRALDALHESEERLNFALAGARMVAWDWDINTGLVVRSANSRQITGFESGPAADFTKAIHPDDRQKVKEAVDAAISGRAAFDVEFRINTPDGRQIWVLDKARLRLDSAGRPSHLTGISMDITERKRAEQLLLEADRRKNEFLAMLAHELRNPLAPIRSAAEILRLLGPDNDKLKWARDIIERQVQHMTRLIDDLLDISRISRGKIQLQKSPVNIVSIVARAMETVRPLIDARRQQMQVTMPPEPGMVFGDSTRLVQVLSNLLHNAMKYTPEGGKIHLTVSRAPEHVHLIVRDTGVGIPEEMLERVFDLFTQLGDVQERSQGGLGIGLTLARTLVEMHEGKISARSKGRGRGSEFTVTLPLLPDVHEVLPAPPGESVEPARQKLSILVVDDNRDAADSLTMLLDLIGHRSRSANDGEAALTLAKELRPDVIFVDIDLPGMHGFDVCRRLREQPENGRAVCVALTGFGSAEDRERSKQTGFDHHLVKPVEVSRVKDLLAQIQQQAGG